MIQTRPLSVEEICNKLRPVFGKKIDEIYFQYSVAEDRDEREEIAHLLNALYQKNLSKLLDKGVLLEPPAEELVLGDYAIAEVSYAGKKLYNFNLRERDWQRHICITGMSGSGKTTLAMNLVEELQKHNKPFLVFDWKKSFRPLIALNPRLMAFTVGDESTTNLFKLNINRPPKGVAPREWLIVLADLLTESFMASFGVHKILLETLDGAFKEWGVYNGSENYPTWNHIKWRLDEKAQKAEGREFGWLESAMRIATVLTFGELGKVLNYKGEESISVEELLQNQVIMELNTLGNVEKKFFCELLLTYIYKMKKARQNGIGSGFDHAIIVDEAHNIFLKKPTTFANESVTDMIYREMREYGTSLICLDQHISKISDTVKGNSACHIAFQQQLPADIEDISGLMQLKESKHFFSSLQVGTAIVKLSERHTYPFLIEVPFAESRNIKVTNEDIKSRMRALMLNQNFKENKDPEFNKQIAEPKLVEEKIEKPKQSDVSDILHDFIIEHLNAGIELEEIEKILEQSKSQGRYTTKDIIQAVNRIFDKELKKENFKKGLLLRNNDTSSEIDLNDEERKFIEFLQENPNHNLSTVEVYKAIGLSSRKGTIAKKSLEEKNLLKIEEIKYDKGWKKLIRLKSLINQ